MTVMLKKIPFQKGELLLNGRRLLSKKEEL